MHDSIAASRNVKVVLMAPLPRMSVETTRAMNSQWNYQNRHERRKEYEIESNARERAQVRRISQRLDDEFIHLDKILRRDVGTDSLKGSP